MASNYKVGVEVTADTKQAEKNLDSTAKEIEKVGDAAKEASKSTDNWEKSFKDFGKTMQDFGKNLSLYVTAPITGFAALAVSEFIQAEKELNQLNIALNNAGNFSAAAVSKFKALADELERTTNFSGGAVISASALAVNFTKTTAEAERLVKAATDLSAATGVDLESAVQSLGLSLNGVSGALGKTLPQVRDLTEEQLKAGAAIKIVEERFKGSALQATQTLGGEITRLKNGFNAFAEDIGSQVAPYIQAIVRNLNDLLNYIRNLSPEVRNSAIAFGLLAAAAGPVIFAIGTFVKLIPTLQAGLNVIVGGFKALLVFLNGPAGVAFAFAGLAFAVAGFINLFLDLKAVTNDAGKAFVLTWRWVTSQFEQFVIKPILSGLRSLYDVLAKIPVVGDVFRDSSRFVGGLIDGIKARATEINAEVATVFEGTGKTAASSFTFGLSDYLADFKDTIAEKFTIPVTQGLAQVKTKTTETVKELSKTQKELLNSVGNTAVNTFTDAFSSIADGSKSASEAFGDMIDSMIADLTRLILQQSIMQGLSGLFGNVFGPSGGVPTAGAAVATGGFFNGRGITHRFAEGGMVNGPGSGTSDSILARLSNGEFVSDAKTTSFFGPEFFVNLKRMARSGSRPSPFTNGIPAFANGGMVSGAGMGDTRIVIQNSGSPKNAKNVTTEQDAQGTVVNIILEDIQKNGSVAKSLQTNYGLKRGGV